MGALTLQLPWMNPILHPTMVIRREVFEAIGDYENYRSEDLGLFTRLLANHQVANIPRVLVNYRIHSSQVSRHYYSVGNNDSVFESRRRLVAQKFGDKLAKSITPEVHACISRRPILGSCPHPLPIRTRRKSLIFLVTYLSKVVWDAERKSETLEGEFFRTAALGFRRVLKP